MITLYQFPAFWGLPNVSPFCLKIETYLRMAGLAYEIHASVNTKKAPKAKFPYIDDNGKKIGDSSLIIEYLQQQYGDKLDGHLDASQRALGLALQRLMEEHLYWIMVYSRWIDPKGWKISKETFFGKLPAPVKFLIPPLVQHNMKRALYTQGIGRHTPEEIYEFGKADITTLATLLGERSYFLGSTVSSLDATAFAFIANILHTPIESPLKQCAQGFENLVAYYQRIHAAYYAK